MIKFTKKSIKINNFFIQKNESSKIILPVFQGVDIYNGVEEYEKDLKKFSQEQRYVFAISWYQSEVDNGGHHQFYYNATGIVYEDALKGLKIICAYKHHQILKESSIRMGDGLKKEREVRLFFLERQKINFGDLDDRFFKLNRSKPLEKLLKKYILENREKFYFEGEVEVSDFDPKQFTKDFFEKYGPKLE